MKILEKKQAELIPRIEITAEIEHISKATPSKENIKELLSKETKTEKDLIIIKDISSIFGETKSKILAYIYKDKNSIKKIEKQSKKERKAEKDAAKSKKEAQVKEQKQEIKEDGKEKN